MNTNEILFTAFVVLNLLDIYTTLTILSRGGRELNPVMAWLMRKLGVKSALVLSKAALLGVVAYYLSEVPPWALVVSGAMYAGILANNFFVIKQQQQQQS